MTTVNYDEVAHRYDRRYELHEYAGIRAVLLAAVAGLETARILEVGCGTGKWLALLHSAGCSVAGLDPSAEMLRRASLLVPGDLRLGSAEALPWGEASFDVVFYVNAFHHFEKPAAALCESHRVLRSGGKIVSIGLDPHEGGGRWYVYTFFPSTLALDLARFPSRAQRTLWLREAGFTGIDVAVAEHLRQSNTLDAALRDGCLEQSFTSQLTTLSPGAYDDGMRRIRAAASGNEGFRVEVDLKLYVTVGEKVTGE